MKTHHHLAVLLALSLGHLQLARAQAPRTPQAPGASATQDSASIQEKVKAEFAFWRYAGARIDASFARGPVSLLSISTPDDLERVWKFYTGRIPTDNKLPLSSSWDIPGDNTMVGASTVLDSSYALSLNSAPREAGTIIYQRGSENIVIEIRARTPEQFKSTGQQTDIRLIKMRPLRATATSKPPAAVPGTASPGAASPARASNW